MELEVREGLPYVGQTKRNRHSAAKPKGKSFALPLDLNELPEEGASVLKQYESGLVELPTSRRASATRRTTEIAVMPSVST